MAVELYTLKKDTVSGAQTSEFLPDRNQPNGLARLDAQGNLNVSSVEAKNMLSTGFGVG